MHPDIYQGTRTQNLSQKETKNKKVRKKEKRKKKNTILIKFQTKKGNYSFGISKNLPQQLNLFLNYLDILNLNSVK